MKAIFFFLLLVNLSYWLYESYLDPNRPAAAIAFDPANLREPIVLAAESRTNVAPNSKPALTSVEPPVPAPAPANASKPLQSADTVCLEFGPFTSSDLLQAWQKAANAVAADIKIAEQVSSRTIGTLVLLPLAGGTENVGSILEDLRANGVKDAYLITSGENRGAIALGAFQQESRAQSMQKDLQSRGIKAVVKHRSTDLKENFAVIKGIVPSEDGFNRLIQGFPGVAVKTLPPSDSKCAAPNRVATAESAGSDNMPPQENPAQLGNLSAAPNNADAKPADVIQAQSDTAETRQQTPDSIQTAVCFEFGPLTEQQRLSEWQREIAEVNGRMTLFYKNDKVIVDYLVLYSVPKGELAKTSLQKLRDKGLASPWLIFTRENAGKISLGIFSNVENAKRNQLILREQGIPSIVSPRYKNKRQRYAIITGDDSAQSELEMRLKAQAPVPFRRLPIAKEECRSKS